MIKCIIFDYGNVIALSRSGKFRDALFSNYGVDPGKVRQYWQHYNNQYEIGAMNSVQFMNGLRNFLGTDISIQTLTNLFFLSDQPEHNMIYIIRKLSEYFEIAILSNSNPLLTNKIKHDSYFRNIRVKVFSDEIHIRKPDPRAYEYTLKLLEYYPNECIFVDDKEENVVMANKLGMEGILYKGHPRDLYAEIMNIHKREEELIGFLRKSVEELRHLHT